MEGRPANSIAPADVSLPSPFRRAPWDAPDLFPPKPDDAEYGWRYRGRSHPCTREELIEKCRAGGKQHVELIWTPETPRLVPPAEVPWLLEPLRERARADLAYNLRIDAALLLVGIAYVAYTLWYHRGAQGQGISPIYLAAFLLFGIVPAAQDLWALSRLRRSYGLLAEQAAALRYGVWLGGRRIAATYFVGAALVAVWAAQVVVGLAQSIAAAGLVKPLVRMQHQWWRLLTAELLHGHWFHIVLNLLSLLAVGRLVEVHGGTTYLTTVFLVSALTASLASLFLGPGMVSVGASGGIMGLVGFLAVLGYRRRHVLPRGFLKSISLSIALTAGAGLVAANVIDNAAHFGGLLGGVLLGFVYVGRRGAGGLGAEADGSIDPEREYRLRPSLPARIAGGLCGAMLAAATFLTIWMVLRARLESVTP